MENDNQEHREHNVDPRGRILVKRRKSRVYGEIPSGIRSRPAEAEYAELIRKYEKGELKPVNDLVKELLGMDCE